MPIAPACSSSVRFTCGNRDADSTISIRMMTPLKIQYMDTHGRPAGTSRFRMRSRRFCLFGGSPR